MSSHDERSDEPTEGLVARALELLESDPAAFEAFCRAHPGQEPRLRKRVDILREAGLAGTRLLFTPIEPAKRPEQVGPYRILDKLGAGAMGDVYVAEQKEPVRRRVALKVARSGLHGEQERARFDLERQALAVMNHEAIAKIYDAGVTELGQAYFAMELVEGGPLTEYCDARRLTLRERIVLFQKICAGVEHAHQKGVLHRDLKPSNILVTRRGNDNMPKIVDFGVARATGHQLIDAPIYTREGAMIGTPEYMSPEQAVGKTSELDTRTDIYSLGVILYELLAGALPFPGKELRAAGLIEIQRTICEDEPPKPSTRISSGGGSATTWAKARRATVPALVKEVRGDLDWIVLKAIAKEKELRYATAMDLAADLERYLVDEPVSAGPPGAGYRFKKWVRRNRLILQIGCIFGVLRVVSEVVRRLWA